MLSIASAAVLNIETSNSEACIAFAVTYGDGYFGAAVASI